MRKTVAGVVLGVLLLIVFWIGGASFALLYFGVGIYVLALLMIPGYVIASLVFKGSSCSFRIAASTAVTSPIYSVAILLALAAGDHRDTLSSIFALSMIGGSLFILFRRRELIKDFRTTDKTHLKWTLLLFVFAISLMALPISVRDVPYLAGHSVEETRLPIAPGDQYLPYRLEQILLNGADWKGVNFYGIWTVADRTPLMGLVAAFVSSSLHVIPPLDWVWNVLSGAFSWNVFQVVGCMLDAQILLSAYLVLEIIFGTARARLTMPFLAVNPFMIWNTFYTSPKSMAAYFVLLSLILITERKFIWGGVIAALGFLSHSYALFYIIGLLFLICSRIRTNSPKEVRNLLLFGLSAALAVAPWFIWTTFIYGHVSSFLLYPLASSGPDSTLGSAHIVEQFLKAPMSLFVWTRVVNTFRTLFPWPLGITPAWFSQFGWADVFSWTDSINALLLVTYIFTIPGALSLSLTLPAYIAWVRSKSKMLFACTTLPLIFAIIFFGYPTAGLASLMAQPLVPVLACAAVSIVPKPTSKVLFITLLAEHFFFIWVNVYPANLLLTKIRSISDVAIFGALVVWAFATARMTLRTFRSNLA